MSELERSILLGILKSQLEIENVVLISLVNRYNVSIDALRDITRVRLEEIKRQIKVLEKNN